MVKSGILLLGLLFFSFTLASADVGIPIPKSYETSLTPAKGISLPNLASTSKGLLDPSRFSMQHTLGVSFRSGTSGGLNQYYLNNVTYKVSGPLTVQAQFGIQNNLYGTPTYKSSGGGNTQIVVPYIGVLYQPKPNIRIEFGFSNVPSYYYRGGYPY